MPEIADGRCLRVTRRMILSDSGHERRLPPTPGGTVPRAQTPAVEELDGHLGPRAEWHEAGALDALNSVMIALRAALDETLVATFG